MSAKIFLSCGQASDAERNTAQLIRERLEVLGFTVYVAIQAQSIEDVNAGIIRQLKRSDYYIFVDFKRESVGSGSRGSLFTNQELAIAYILGFERVLFFREEGVRLEGLLQYMGSNAAESSSHQELIDKLVDLVQLRGWDTDYSRHLVATRPRWSDGELQFGRLTGRFLYIDIENRRHDIAAYETVARLDSIQADRGQAVSCYDRSHLKAAGQPGFVQMIWPLDHGAFDVLMVDAMNPSHVFLNSALDAWPKAPIIERPGVYQLNYRVLARDFPVLGFSLMLTIDGTLQGARGELMDREEEA
jgi:hypothetical protein